MGHACPTPWRWDLSLPMNHPHILHAKEDEGKDCFRFQMLCNLANYETEPSIHAPPDCLPYIEATITIAEYLRLHCSEDAFGGPVTDTELSESDGETDDLSWLDLGSEPESSNSQSMPQES